jgi:hypothetical protein
MNNYQALESSSSSSTSSLSISSVCSTLTSPVTLSTQINGKSLNNNEVIRLSANANNQNNKVNKQCASNSKNSNENNKSTLNKATSLNKNVNMSSLEKSNKFSSASVGGNNAQQPLSDIDRPPHSYIALISMAILTKNDRKILLNEIYDWVIQNFPYYQHRTDKSWRNSIRHNLSLNECFIKVGKAGNGRGYYWSIHSANINDFKKGDFRRRQARLRAKHDKGSSGAATTSGSEPVSGLVNSSKVSTKQAQHHQNNNSSKIGTNWPTSSNLLNNSNSSLSTLPDHQKLNGFNNYNNMGTNINQSSSQQQHQHNSMYQSQNGCNESVNEVSPKVAFNNSTINYSASSRSYIDQYSNTNHNCQLSHNYTYMPNNQISSNSNTPYFFNNNHLNQFNVNNFNSNITHIKNEPKQTIDSNIISSNGGDSLLQTHVNNSIAKTATGISTSSSLSASPSSSGTSSTSSLTHQNSAIYNLNVLNNFSNNSNFLNSHSYNNSNNSSTLLSSSSSSSPPSSTSSTSPLANHHHQQYNYMNSTFPWHSIQTQSLNTNILDNFSASNATLSYNPHSHMYPSSITSNDSNNESLLAYTNQSLNGSQHYQQLIQPHQPQVISNNTNQNIFHNTYTMK